MNADQSSSSNESTLNSWKEIGAHFGRDGRTAQRWEKEEGLPVYRHLHKGRATVYAFPSELDAWKEARTAPQAVDPSPASPLLHGLLPSFASGMLLLMALISVGDKSPELLRAQAQDGPSPDTVVRQLTQGDYFVTKTSHDGQYATIRRTSGYYVYDVAANQERLVVPTPPPSAEMGAAILSDDSSQLAYTLDERPSDDPSKIAFSIHITEMNGTDDRFLFEDRTHYSQLRLTDWSPSGEYVLAIGMNWEGGVDLLVVNTATGSGAVIKHLPLGQHTEDPGGLFTLDSRYILFNDRDSARAPRDIFAIPVEGGEPTLVMGHPADDGTVGWTADGRLVFESDRSASLGAWIAEVQNLKVMGEPVLLSRNILNVAPNDRRYVGQGPIGFGRNGNLFYSIRTRDVESYTAKLTPDFSKLESAPQLVTKRFEGLTQTPFYSPDGRYLAYVTGLYGSRTIQIRNLESGEQRSLPQPFEVRELVWFPSSQELLLFGGTNGKGFFYRMNVETGQGSVVTDENITTSGQTRPTFDPSGEWIYFITRNEASSPFSENRVVRYRLSTGQLETVYKPDEGVVAQFAISPDGTQLAAYRWDVGLEIVPTSGGEPRVVHTFPEGRFMRDNGALEFTKDGKALLHTQSKGDGFYDDALRITPLDGGPSRELVDTKMLHRLSLHPDGQQLAWWEHSFTMTLWVAENLLPAAPSE